MFEESDISAIETYEYCTQRPEDWSLEDAMHELTTDSIPITRIRAEYQRGKELKDQGYYLVYSDNDPTYDAPMRLLYRNGCPVPAEKLESPVFLREGAAVAMNRMFYRVAVARKQQ